MWIFLCRTIYSIMKRNFKQWWSSIPTMSPSLNWTRRTQKDYNMWLWKSRTWGPGLGQAQKCDGDKLGNGFPILPSWSPTTT